MQMPGVNNFIKDPTGGKYNIVAYRKLSKEEMIQMVRLYLSQKGNKKTGKGQTVRIETIIGYDQ